MSAVVQTGSSDARSACGANVTVFAPSAREIRGEARTADIAADLSTLRRFIRMPPIWLRNRLGRDRGPIQRYHGVVTHRDNASATTGAAASDMRRPSCPTSGTSITFQARLTARSTALDCPTRR